MRMERIPYVKMNILSNKKLVRLSFYNVLFIIKRRRIIDAV
ncbi:hypothetical protein FACS1894184_20510 [Clostridia bacterium]|nr:hypothetical protein FACS1894184_20510 [Clostridia bacterium]